MAGVRVYLTSLGCDKNLVDSEVMLGLLRNGGFFIEESPECADVLIVNTCCFIQDALEESIETIIELGKHKNGGNKFLIVAGCLAERFKREIRNELPEVDAIVGTTGIDRIVDVVNTVVCGEKLDCFDDINLPINGENSLQRIVTIPLHTASLKIAEGCDKNCTYCIIPQLRGKYRSRELNSLIEEALLLRDNGVKELILVAQDTSVYGKDIYGSVKLVDLLNNLCAIDGIEWIRLMYCYPENITDELIDCMANNDKICNYIDMPIQHINDTILKNMGRKNCSQQIRDTINKLRAHIPDICIRTSLITGFPGESDDDFNELLNFVSEIKFERLGVFTYSREEGTAAFNFDNQIDEKIKLFRKNKILRLQKGISREKCSKSVGRLLKVLIEGKIPEDNIYCCRSYMDAPDIDGIVFVKSDMELYSGDFVQVHIQKSKDYDLFGRINYESS